MPESERIASNVNDLEVDFDPAKWALGGELAGRMSHSDVQGGEEGAHQAGPFGHAFYGI